jgi:hypothetical protein
MHTSSFATNTATSFICYTGKKKKEGKRNRKREERGYRGKEGDRSFVRVVVFVRSVSCPVLCCSVALGATATRSIVIALPFSHHHQQAVVAIATESERDRETRPPACVCGSSTTSNVALVVSRVYADSRFFNVVVVVVVIHIEVNHECHQQSPTAGHFDHTIVIIVGIISHYNSAISYRTRKESLVTTIFQIPYLFFLIDNPFLSISMLRRKKTFISKTIGRTNFYEWLYTSKKFDTEYFITPSSFKYIDSKSSKDKYRDDDNNTSNNNINKTNEKTSSTRWNDIGLCVLRFIES